MMRRKREEERENESWFYTALGVWCEGVWRDFFLVAGLLSVGLRRFSFFSFFFLHFLRSPLGILVLLSRDWDVCRLASVFFSIRARPKKNAKKTSMLTSYSFSFFQQPSLQLKSKDLHLVCSLLPFSSLL